MQLVRAFENIFRLIEVYLMGLLGLWLLFTIYSILFRRRHL